MARYNLTIGAKFRPFTYDELLKPIQALTEQHYAAEDAMYEMNSKASLLEQLLGESEDSRSRQMYNDFANELRASAEELYKHGYNASTRKGLMNARHMYASNVLPLEEAKKRREEAIAAQRAANAKGNMRYSKYAVDSSLDDFLDGKYDYTSVDIENAYNKGLAFANQWSQRYSKTEEGIAFGGDYLKLVKTVGLDQAQSAEELALAQENLRRGVQNIIESGKYPGLTQGLKAILDSSGANDLNNKDYNDVVNSILSGAATGIQYKQDENLQQNWRLQKELDYQYAIRMKKWEKEQADLAAGLSDVDVTNRIEEGILSEEDKKYLTKNKDGSYSMKNLNDIAQSMGATSFFIKDAKTGKVRPMTDDEFAKAVVHNRKQLQEYLRTSAAGTSSKTAAVASVENLYGGINLDEEKALYEKAKQNYSSFRDYLFNTSGLRLDKSYDVAYSNKNNRFEATTKKQDYDNAQININNGGRSGSAHGVIRINNMNEAASKNLENQLAEASGNTYYVTDIKGNEYAKTEQYKFREGDKVTQMDYDPGSHQFILTVKEQPTAGKETKVSKVTIPATYLLSKDDVNILIGFYDDFNNATNDASRLRARSEINKIMQKALNQKNAKDTNESY